MDPSKSVLNEKLLPPRDVFTRAELLRSLSKAYPSYGPNDFSWVIAELLRKKILFRVAYGRYSRKEPRRYLGGPTNPLIEKIRTLCLKQDFRFPFVVFGATLLNEGLNELLAHESVVVEVPTKSM